MREPIAVSVVVVAHDSGEDLARCAASVLAQDVALELIVVDNASCDDSLAALPPDPRIRLLLNPDNRGFGRACNQGATLARADALLFLNPDCVLPPDTLPMLLAALHADPRIGALGAQLLNPDGSEQSASRRADPSPLRALRQSLGVAARPSVPPLRSPLPPGEGPGERVRPERTGDAPESFHSSPGAASPDPQPGTPSPPAISATTPTDAISGALMLMPRAVFETLGGFDEGYTLHCEDLDLCRRVRDAGHSVAIAADVRVPHAKGTSSRRRPLWVEWHKHRGMWRYFRKFDAASTPMLLWPALWLGLWTRFALVAPRAWLRGRRQR